MKLALVPELQQLAADDSVDICSVIRKALIGATKLNQNEFKAWLLLELEGYGDGSDIPSYRELRGGLFVQNPYRGLQPFFVSNVELAARLSKIPFRQSIGEIAEMVRRSDDDGQFIVTFSAEAEASLMKSMQPVSMQPVRKVSVSQLSTITSAVRNGVLKWALELEARGVMGDGMTFSAEEKVKAAPASNISIGTFHAAPGATMIGTVVSDNSSVNVTAHVLGALKEQGVSQAKRNEIENIMDQLAVAPTAEKPGVIAKGLEWINANSGTLGLAAEALKTFFS